VCPVLPTVAFSFTYPQIDIEELTETVCGFHTKRSIFAGSRPVNAPNISSITYINFIAVHLLVLTFVYSYFTIKMIKDILWKEWGIYTGSDE
jgi:hypothetical protein